MLFLTIGADMYIPPDMTKVSLAPYNKSPSKRVFVTFDIFRHFVILIHIGKDFLTPPLTKVTKTGVFRVPRTLPKVTKNDPPADPPDCTF